LEQEKQTERNEKPVPDKKGNPKGWNWKSQS